MHRFKSWSILSSRFQSCPTKHPSCFFAVAVIICIELDTGWAVQFDAAYPDSNDDEHEDDEDDDAEHWYN